MATLAESQAAPDAAQGLQALRGLSARLAAASGADAAVAEVADVLGGALGAARVSPPPALVEDSEARLALEQARLSGQVSTCSGAAASAEPFALLVPIRTGSPPFEALMFQRKAPFTEAAQALAEVAASLLEAALRQRVLCHELRDSRSQLEQSERIKSVGQLASGVAHDFNNLLMVISAAAEVMADGLEPEHPSGKHLKLILETSHRAAELTQQLLAFSRKARPAMKPVDVHDVLATVRELLAHGIDRRITLTFSPCAGTCVVEADATQLGNALLNVCLNARDAMPEGGLLRITSERVELDAEACASRYPGCEPGAYVRLDVKDTGAGMDEQTLARAFEPFYTTKEPGRGTGLGLPVALAAVRAHRGSVLLRSEPGGGTTCSILLPLLDGGCHGTGLAAPASRRVASLRVLLVDDEPRVCLSAAQLMRQLGHNVQALCSGEKALSHLRVHSSGYDLLVLDLMMPHPTGIEVDRALCALGIHLPTLFMSGSPDVQWLGESAAGQPPVFLQKPFRQAELALAIDRCIDAWRSRTTAALDAPLRTG